MDANRFDTIARLFATRRLSRRAAIGAAAGFLAAPSLRHGADAQVSQAQCGNTSCRNNPGKCAPGCVCCVYGNGSARCRPPGECGNGTVACPAGLTPCGGACVDPATFASDPANCGACGTVCGTGQACGGGICQTDCGDGVDIGGGQCQRTFDAAGTTNWTVPGGVTSVRFDVYGAQGGNELGAGGQGGRASGTLAVGAEETLAVVVGQRGGKGGTILTGGGTGGVGGAPNGGGGGTGSSSGGGGGGGSSEVQRGGVRLIVGGGGGGASASSAGGSGGGASGGDGVPSTSGNQGFGATPIGPGAGGFSVDSTSNPGSAGTAGGQGGTGGGAGIGLFGGGGGGGGFFGGGGGSSSGTGGGGRGGGGGGNGFVDPGAFDPILESGVRAGDGLVVITYSV